MKFFNFVFIGLAASAGAKSIVSRSSGYGDEAVTPAPVTEAPAPAGGYGGPAPVAPVAPAPVEQTVTETKQEYNAVVEQPKVEQSGYRKKRGAAYGDEAVTPAPVTEAPAPAGGYGGPAPVAPVAPAPVEQTVTETKQEYNAVVEQPKVEQSGYRKKRGAAYGDEAVTPAPVTEAPAPAGGYGGPAPVAPVAPAPVETVVTETKQEYNAVVEQPKVEQSGYRKKRGAAYGDEAVTPAPVTEAPAPAGGYGGPAPVAPVAPAPVETVVTETKQEYNAVVEQPKVEQSGYRKKRGAAYGDEAVTPAPVTEAPAPAGGYGGPAPVAPVAPAPVEQTVTETKQEYNAVVEQPKVEQSGYRKKRGAAYGDEAVTPAPVTEAPAPAGGYGGPAPVAPVAPAPVEQTVTETKQEYNAVVEQPKVEQSGYRKKRGAAYGDEAVTPAPVTEAPAPAGGYGGPAPVAPVAPAPVEQTVTETKQEYNAVVEQPKVEQSGYRKKRGAAYGDEAVTPAPVTEAPAPAGGYGGPAPVAPVAPAPVETVVTETKQDYNAAPSPSVPETQPSGY